MSNPNIFDELQNKDIEIDKLVEDVEKCCLTNRKLAFEKLEKTINGTLELILGAGEILKKSHCERNMKASRELIRVWADKFYYLCGMRECLIELRLVLVPKMKICFKIFINE